LRKNACNRGASERYPWLLRAVIGFRATVLESRIKFKLGQNERDDVYRDIVTGLQRTGNPRLAEAMENLNHRCPDLLRATTFRSPKSFAIGTFHSAHSRATG
jgi:hypothetical protein